MYDAGREPIGFVRYTWKEALTLKGASQLIHLKNLLLSFPYFERIPDQSVLISPKVGDEHIRCTRGNDFMLIYLPMGGELEFKTSGLSGNEFQAEWYNPRNGESNSAGTLLKSDYHKRSAPSQGRGCDWVLVVKTINN